MEPVLRIVLLLGSLLACVINVLLSWVLPRKKPTYPPIQNKLLTLSLGELVAQIRTKQLTSEKLVRLYIERIQKVNAVLNAVVEDRFEEAIQDAQRADKLIAKAKPEQLVALFQRYPLLGIPFTVKEACGVKGMSFVIGNIHRMHEKSPDNGDVVALLRSAGCIPLLVSANPEFCLSYETNTHVHGRCLNPYDLRRTSAGSSSGEAALNGAGATVFGVVSDLAGSTRLPALFCGVFGHKPTGGLLPINGHFPHSKIDVDFSNIMQMGPMSRFAKDLPLLMQLMAGQNANKLQFDKPIAVKDIKIHYAYGFDGLNGWLHPPVNSDIKLAILRAVKCFEKGGLVTKPAKIEKMRNSLEICVFGILGVRGVPSLISQSVKNRPSSRVLVNEFIRSLFGHSLYTTESLLMELCTSLGAAIPEKYFNKYKEEAQLLKQEIIELLGNDGVLFLPTYHTPALHFNTSILNLVGVEYMLLFNFMGLPVTQVPMGLDRHGLPVGFQVIAAPNQDRLCLQIAAELETAFGGWTPPIPHEFN